MNPAPPSQDAEAPSIDAIHVDPGNDRPLGTDEYPDAQADLARWVQDHVQGGYRITASRLYEVRDARGTNWAFMETYFDGQARTHFGAEREAHFWHEAGIGAATVYAAPARPDLRIVVATPEARLPNGHMIYGLFELRKQPAP